MTTAGRTLRQLGEPPDWLDDLALPLIEPAVTELFQSHAKERGPLNFNPTPRGRFNAPNGEYATTYLSTSPEGAFVETFVQDAVRSASGQAIVTRARLDAYCLCRMPYGVGAGTRALCPGRHCAAGACATLGASALPAPR